INFKIMSKVFRSTIAISLFPVLAFAQLTDSIATDILLREVVIEHRHNISEANQLQKKASGQMQTDKLLERIPGIQMVRRGNYAWEPTIRSLNAGQINVTIDGMHIFGACT